jgi:hypothetical protein
MMNSLDWCETFVVTLQVLGTRKTKDYLDALSQALVLEFGHDSPETTALRVFVQWTNPPALAERRAHRRGVHRAHGRRS